MPSVCRRSRHRFGQERADHNMSASLQALSSDRLRVFMSQNNAAGQENCPVEPKVDHMGLLLLDCRPFLAYNKSHIEGSINVHCPAILRRRNGGRLPLRTVVPSADIRTNLADGFCHPVVLYDEQKFCQQHTLRNCPSSVAPGQPGEDSMAIFVAKCLQSELNLKNIFILEGGYDDFNFHYPGLCTQPSTDSSTPYARAKCSPSSTYITNGNSHVNRQGSSPLSGHSPQDCPVEILPHLFLGDAHHASCREILERLGITALLNVSNTCPNHFEDSFTYKSIPVQDSGSEDIGSWFEEAINFIENVKAQNGRVLVHCRAGISRSATICMAYLMSTKRLRMEEAYEFVKLRRRIVSPNFNFMGQLLSYESQVFGGPCVRPVSPLPAVSPVLDPDPDALTPSCGASQNQGSVFDFPMSDHGHHPLTRSPAKAIVLTAGATLFIS